MKLALAVTQVFPYFSLPRRSHIVVGPSSLLNFVYLREFFRNSFPTVFRGRYKIHAQIPPYVVIMRAATRGKVPFSRAVAINPGRAGETSRDYYWPRTRVPGRPALFLITR